MSKVTATLEYKKFTFELFIRDESRDNITVTQTNLKNAESKLMQHYGGKAEMKKAQVRFNLVSESEIIVKHGDFLTYNGKPSTNHSWSKDITTDFTIGNRYQVMKAGASLYVVSDSGAQTKINPIVFNP